MASLAEMERELIVERTRAGLEVARQLGRDPEMHQTRKGNQWYFGLKAHIGVDAKQGTMHTMVTTAANVSDCRVLPDLLHGEERKVWGDGGYQGQTEAIREVAPKAQDMTCKRTRYKNRVDQLQRAKNRSKSSVRAKVGHPSAS
jgi:IS5 family transposase